MSKKKGIDKNKMADARISEISKEHQIKMEGAVQASIMIDQAGKYFHAVKTKKGIHDKYACEMFVDGMIYVMADLMAHGYMEKYYADPVEEVKKYAVLLHERITTIIQIKKAEEVGLIVPADGDKI